MVPVGEKCFSLKFIFNSDTKYSQNNIVFIYIELYFLHCVIRSEPKVGTNETYFIFFCEKGTFLSIECVAV